MESVKDKLENDKQKSNRFRQFLDSEMFYNYRRSITATSGSIIIVLFILMSLLGPLVTSQDPYDLTELNISNSYIPPSWEAEGDIEFLLGTDAQGRDLASAIVYGSRISLFIGIAGALFSCIVGTILGIIAGYYGGKIDSIIMRIADIQLSFPAMLIALFMMSVFGRGIGKLLLALTLVGWVNYARTVRGVTLSEKNKEYIQATKAIGFPNRKIILKHILPNVVTPIIVLVTMQVGDFILTEATLSFLGVGVPVTEPSLGMLIKNGFDVLFSGIWWTSVFPGIFIVLIVFGINLLGDFLRDELNPKLK